MKIYPTHEFAYELSLIQSDVVRELVVKALRKVPAYFWVVPASSSGGYHSRLSLGIGGLMRHVKGVFSVSEILLGHPTMWTFQDITKDYIRGALLLHDGLKQGLEEVPTHTVHEHPMLPRQHLRPDDLTDEEKFHWNIICQLIESHSGPWNTDAKGTSEIVLPVPITDAQKFVHLCDYLGSRKEIEVDVFIRSHQAGYKKPDPEPATESQLTFIANLYKKAQDKKKDVSAFQGITLKDNDKVMISKREASDLINQLKELTS